MILFLYYHEILPVNLLQVSSNIFLSLSLRTKHRKPVKKKNIYIIIANIFEQRQINLVQNQERSERKV